MGYAGDVERVTLWRSATPPGRCQARPSNGHAGGAASHLCTTLQVDHHLLFATLACAQALTGAAVVVDALDGRRLRIPAPGVLAAGAELRAAGEGLCGKVVCSTSSMLLSVGTSQP